MYLTSRTSLADLLKLVGRKLNVTRVDCYEEFDRAGKFIVYEIGGHIYEMHHNYSSLVSNPTEALASDYQQLTYWTKGDAPVWC